MLAAGQALFKRAGLAIRDQATGDAIATLLGTPSLYLALILYGLATLLWIWILSRVPLSLAYPWVGAGMIIVPLIGVLFFDERVSPIFWIGIMLIICGICITQAASPSPPPIQDPGSEQTQK